VLINDLIFALKHDFVSVPDKFTPIENK